MHQYKQIEATSTMEQLSTLLSILQDFARISEHARIRVYGDQIFLFCTDSIHKTMVMKYYQLDISALWNEDLDQLDLVLLNLKPFIAQFKFYQDFNLPITWTFDCIDGDDLGGSEKLVRNFKATNTKLQSFIIAGEPYTTQNLTLEKVTNMTDPANCRWSYTIEQTEMERVQKMAQLDSNSETIQFCIEGENFKAKDRKWQIDIGFIDSKFSGEVVDLNKKFLTYFKAMPETRLDIFGHYAVVRTPPSTLLLSLDLTEY